MRVDGRVAMCEALGAGSARVCVKIDLAEVIMMAASDPAWLV